MSAMFGKKMLCNGCSLQIDRYGNAIRIEELNSGNQLFSPALEMPVTVTTVLKKTVRFDGTLVPIMRFSKDLFGQSYPNEEIIISAAQRIFVPGSAHQGLGTSVAASSLISENGVTLMDGNDINIITYYAIALEKKVPIVANGLVMSCQMVSGYPSNSRVSKVHNIVRSIQ